MREKKAFDISVPISSFVWKKRCGMSFRKLRGGTIHTVRGGDSDSHDEERLRGPERGLHLNDYCKHAAKPHHQRIRFALQKLKTLFSTNTPSLETSKRPAKGSVSVCLSCKALSQLRKPELTGCEIRDNSGRGTHMRVGSVPGMICLPDIAPLVCKREERRSTAQKFSQL